MNTNEILEYCKARIAVLEEAYAKQPCELIQGQQIEAKCFLERVTKLVTIPMDLALEKGVPVECLSNAALVTEQQQETKKARTQAKGVK